MTERDGVHEPGDHPDGDIVTLAFGGDVMIGRGIDQVLEQSVDPRLDEPFVRSALRYVELAEEAGGPIPAPVDPPYVWGEALPLLDRIAPDLRIVNLETAVTADGRPWKGKGIHYRTHPANVDVLVAAGIDCCVLANNHALDWGRDALLETIDVLRKAGIAVAGAGRGAREAAAPAVLRTASGVRVAVHAVASPTSGVPREWQAGTGRPGVSLIDEAQPRAAEALGARVERHEDAADLHVVSIHWGGNWGYDIPKAQRTIARHLVEEQSVAAVHGHSSHHAKGVAVGAGSVVLFGSGDLLNDYEGIGGRERYRPELVLLHVVSFPLDGGGRPAHLRMWPFRIRRFRLARATNEERAWLRRTIDRESRALGTRVLDGRDGSLVAPLNG